MNILIIPDSFKGSLTATEVSKEIHKAIKKIMPNSIVNELPFSDGGEGAIDLQSLNCKGPIALIKYIDNLKIKNLIRIAIAGKFDYSLNERFSNFFDYIFSISDMKKTEDVIMDSKKHLVEESMKIARFINHLDI